MTACSQVISTDFLEITQVFEIHECHVPFFIVKYFHSEGFPKSKPAQKAKKTQKEVKKTSENPSGS